MKARSFAGPALSLKWGLPVTLALALAFLAACTGGQPETAATPTTASAAEPTAATGSNEPSRGQAIVNSIDILLMESFPVQVSVLAQGDLPDTCTQIDEVISQRTDDLFRVAITTLRQPDAACAQTLVPFEENIPLDVVDLPAGTYTVTVNGVSDTFTLDVDNTLGDEGTTGAGSAVAGATGISGFVWHDLCSQTGATVEAGATPEEGCVSTADGATLVADGERQGDEPGIPGVQVSLLAGDCTSAVPGDEIVVTTDESGAFHFGELTPDTYCVFLDTELEANIAILEEGLLTFPTNNGVATNSVTVTLEEGAGLTDVNFGYDFRFQPTPAAAADCGNSFEFVQDLTVPDDTVFPPGAEFEAAWRLRNNGTCPWTTDYGVTFISGDAMGITTTVPLETPVAPGETADISVTLTAPTTPGSYRSNWQISDAAGTAFGMNGQASEAFWVQIIVEEGAEARPPTPGSAAIGGIVWEDVCFLTDGAPSRGCVETEEGSGFYRGNATRDSNEVGLAGISVILGRGACPPGGIIAAADRVATTVTADDGTYRFEGLDADIYCVSIDALSAENVNLLIPGNWTWPAPGTGRQGIRLAGGQERTDVDFGWDFQE
jgi:hypothetical protein